MARNRIVNAAESNPLILRTFNSVSRNRVSGSSLFRNVFYVAVAIFITTLLCVVSYRSERASNPLTRSVTGPIVFAAIGDWGRHGKYGQNETAHALGTVIPSDTLFISSVGDNFYERGVASVNDPQFIESFQRIYSHPRLLPIPWYLVLGNHDHRGSFTAQIQYSTISPRWNMPARYFVLRISPQLLAIHIDTTPFVDTYDGINARSKLPDDPSEQIAWLHQVFITYPRTTRFVIVGHHNMYSSSVVGHYGQLSLRDRIEPVLRPYSNQIIAYIAGHEHSLMHMQPYGKPGQSPLSNIDHFVTGAGSRLRPVVPPPSSRDSYWRKCCGVLSPSLNESVPRTVWTQTINGFFIFRLDGDLFYATAYDDSANAIYKYERQLPSL